MKFVNIKSGLVFTSNNEMVIEQMKKNPELKAMEEVTKEVKEVAKEEVKETPKKKKK